MLPAIVSGIVTGDAPVSYRSIFFPSLVTYPEVFAKVNPTQFPRSTVVNFLRACFMIFQRLKRYRCIEAINEAVARKSYSTGNRLVCFVFFSFSKLVQKGNFERPLKYMCVIRLVSLEKGLGCAEFILVEDINVAILRFEEW